MAVVAMSTPLRNKDLEKFQTLRVSLTPLRRGSLVPFNLNESTQSNDDDRERNKRRHREVENKRISQIISQIPAVPESPRLEGESLTKHYDMCLKLFADNKINARNVWNLKIIEYMNTIIQSQPNMTSAFKVASTTLDMSAKVYGIRVDEIYSEGMKLANSMARNAGKEIEPMEALESGDEIENDKVNVDGEKKTTKKVKIKFKRTTLVKNLDLILGEVPQIDVVNSHSSLMRDKQTTDQMFLSTLPLDHEGNFLISISDETEFAPINEPTSLCNKNKEIVVPNVVPANANNKKLCPLFNDFVIDMFNPAENMSILENCAEKLDKIVTDEQGFPIPDLEGSNHFIDHFEEEECIEDMVSEEQGDIVGEVNHVIEFRPEPDNNVSNEYLHNMTLLNKRVTGNLWAGPSFWKNKYIRIRASVRYTGKDVLTQKVTRTKKPKIDIIDINVNEATDIEFQSFDMNDLLEVKNMEYELKLSTAELEKYVEPKPINYESKTRRAPLGYASMSLDAKIFNINQSRPDPFAESVASPPEVGLDDVNENFDYSNENDAEYCSQSQNNLVIEENVGMPEGEHNGIMDNLVDLPELVPKTYVNYVTHAKKMNMKKLKEAVWDTFNNKSTICEKRPNYDELDFSKLYEDVPRRLPQKMQQDLSVHLTFVSLLHLANENDLELEKTNPSDFKVFRKRSGTKRKSFEFQHK